MKRTLHKQLVADLGLDTPFYWGQVKKVKNCWHFSTDGKAVDVIFYDERDFLDGMNRVYIVSKKHNIVILAFSLMDTHVHFILYGDFDSCNRFVHEYVRRTSQYIANTHGDKNKLDKVPVRWQEIDTEDYLKTSICYVVKNAPVAGKASLSSDYPWSSGPLYFRTPGTWCSPCWTTAIIDEKDYAESTDSLTVRRKRELFHTRTPGSSTARMMGDLVFPGEYVDYKAVERIFRTQKAYHYFFCRSREDEVESRGGSLSLLSIPMQEMRENKNRECRELFGHESTNRLDIQQRLRLAKVLRKKYNSSKKQIARLCGLVYNEVKDQF